MAFDLTGRKALVVGAAGRLGRSIAVALAEAGADVACATVLPRPGDVADVESAAEQVRSLGRTAEPIALDVTSSSDVDAAVASASGALGGLDILVNNPDVVFAKPAIQVSDDEWERVLAVNLSGVFFASRAVGAAMLDSGGGRIINVVSLLGERGMVNSAAYCAAKAGVVNLTRALSAEWVRDGISVTGLGVGFLEGSAWSEDPSWRNSLERYLPMRRLGLPEEVAPAVVYLAAQESAFMSGQTLYLEGGAFSHI